jgi:hypothetical protein
MPNKYRIGAIRHTPAALPAISCCIAVTEPSGKTTGERGTTSMREKQVVEKMIRTLEDNLEMPLLMAGWRMDHGKTPLPDPRATEQAGVTQPSMQPPMSKIQVPGVPLAIQLYSASNRQSGLPQVETQLYFGDWASTLPDETSPMLNMVVHIKADPQVSSDVLRMIDWQKIGEALGS